jgi:nucleoside-diphosphate-sugar epimerase
MRHTRHTLLAKVIILLICFVAKINTMTLEKFYHNKRVLITGGCGFIGSHIAKQLVALNARITILDNLTTGTIENIKNIHSKVTFIKGDITDFNTCLHATTQ